MAFNFNWSPLAADETFYTRARELLTNALNRGGPRPAIIVDDILVNELNLGDVPPSLEIVEIGDLAEDKFRGTFKMSYNGNAYLALKTRVQANPLNTYLKTRPSFAAPQPLAAATGLTIPLQITLSDIRLSGFIILVFSKQKGLTIVFKDDPLESLKVSSTFDSIPFVSNFLQKEIEGQLRILLMDELPAIIHRLSLRFWVPEHNAREERELGGQHREDENSSVDPLASPPEDPVDSSGNVLSPAEVASLSLDSSFETQSLFSKKNLIRLATLTDSHRTLSLFTPSISDAVFRAWTGPLERGEMPGLRTRAPTPALSRAHSYSGSMSTTYTFDSISHTRMPGPGLPSQASVFASSTGRQMRNPGTRKRKKRVVNLRKQTAEGEPETIIEDGSTMTDTMSVTESTSSEPSIFSAPPATSSSGMYRDLELSTPPMSPSILNDDSNSIAAMLKYRPDLTTVESRPKLMRTQTEPESTKTSDHTTQSQSFNPNDTIRTSRRQRMRIDEDIDATPRASMYLPERKPAPENNDFAGPSSSSNEASAGPSSQSKSSLPEFLQFVTDPANGAGIAERAWMMKMASEISRRYGEEREKGSFRASARQEEETAPPPAYTK